MDLSLCEFMSLFRNIRPNNFSYEGQKTLYEYLQDTNQEIDNIIELCCNYTEYIDLEDFYTEYDRTEYPTIESIQNSMLTLLINNSNSFIIKN